MNALKLLTHNLMLSYAFISNASVVAKKSLKKMSLNNLEYKRLTCANTLYSYWELKFIFIFSRRNIKYVNLY